MSASLTLAGVVGYPVAHSLSPKLHGFWLKQHRIHGCYLPLAVRPEQFSLLIHALQVAGFAGVNVTIPHKQAAFAICETVDEGARKTGAANLIIFRNSQIHGFNTDVGGLCASLEQDFGRVSLAGKKAVLLGAGGAARAAIVALDRLGMAEIRVVNRDPGRMTTLIGELRRHATAELLAFEWQRWPEAADAAALLLNATSGGMAGERNLTISLEPLPKEATVYDLVYNPSETILLKQARERGHKCANGLGMLMHQAVPSFEAFFGIRPAVTPELQAELEQALSL
ncbi:MAG: shikimate dehydrogenase [Alphaproteobacteria bacterium]|nr:shikimate dehydrogenase [Alphaproteobacteria bacterium]